jgi:hypothetical protein
MYLRDDFSTLHPLNERLTLTGEPGLLNEPVSIMYLRDDFSTLHSLNERLALTGEPLACGRAEQKGRRSQKHL